MKTNKVTYTELANAKVSKARNILISSCSKGGYTMAQQLEANEGDKTTNVFLKGAFHIDGIEGLVSLRDALNVAIKNIEDSEVNEEDWDE